MSSQASPLQLENILYEKKGSIAYCDVQASESAQRTK